MSERWTKEDEERLYKDILKERFEEKKRIDAKAKVFGGLMGCLVPIVVLGLFALVCWVLSLIF